MGIGSFCAPVPGVSHAVNDDLDVPPSGLGRPARIHVGHYNYSGPQLMAGIPAGMNVPGVNFQTQVAP
jgi:hypothetical protein